jgi:hypothetical protein
LLIPNIGFGGAEPPPCSGQNVFVLPAYMGNITLEWQYKYTGNCSQYFPGNYPCGDVILYGSLNCAERGCKDINITKKKAITLKSDVAQVDFLGLEPTSLLVFGGGSYITLNSKNFGVSSANDLDYKTDKLFTVDVVVMEVDCIP